MSTQQKRQFANEYSLLTPTRHLLRTGLYALCLGLLAAGAIACEPQSSDTATPVPNPSESISEATSSPTPGESSPSDRPTTAESPAGANQKVYENQQFGFQFNYPKDFVVVDQSGTSDGSDGRPLAAIQIWSEADNQAIQAGDYEGGTEYPPNASLTINPNPAGKSVSDWIDGTEWFVQPDNYEPMNVAGQQAIAFHSTGLYEMDHVAFPSPDGNHIILITVGREAGDMYAAAYDQVINSFQFK